MASYTVSVERKAIKVLRKMPTRYSQRVVRTLDALREEPRPDGCAKLQGQDGLYRIRVGPYRVIYEIRDTELLVLVIRIGDRKDIYR